MTNNDFLSDLSADLLLQLRDEVINLLVTKALPIIHNKATKISSKQNETGYDVVTDVDIKVEAIVIDALKKTCAKLLPKTLSKNTIYVGEENFVEMAQVSQQLIWVLDPLDGTLNFANGLPNYCISLGLIADGIPVLGIVIDVISGEIFDAINGNGARLNKKKITWNNQDDYKAPMTLSTGTIRWLLDNDCHNLLSDLFNMNGRLRLAGSQALQLCWAATGRLGININREARIWDDIAGALIAKEAGASYTRLDDNNIFNLQVGDQALAGEMLFSLCGDPKQIDIAKKLLIQVKG